MDDYNIVDLVSVCVVTYNSSSTICETLDSIYNQTYNNIELVVSDDCSKDDTYDIMQAWVKSHDDRLSNIIVLRNPKNLGTAANLANAIEHSSGKWIKVLAGDDLLPPDSIKEFYIHTLDDNTQFFICHVKAFSDSGEMPAHIQRTYDGFFQTGYLSLDQKKKKILKTFSYPGPAWFFSRALYDKLGGFDLKYPMNEEWPFVYNVLNAGYDIRPINEYLVLYRFSMGSVSHTKKNTLPNENFIFNDKSFYHNVRKKQMLKNYMFVYVIDASMYFFLRTWQYKIYHKTGKVNNAIMWLQYLSPLTLARSIKSKLF